MNVHTICLIGETTLYCVLSFYLLWNIFFFSSSSCLSRSCGVASVPPTTIGIRTYRLFPYTSMGKNKTQKCSMQGGGIWTQAWAFWRTEALVRMTKQWRSSGLRWSLAGRSISKLVVLLVWNYGFVVRCEGGCFPWGLRIGWFNSFWWLFCFDICSILSCEKIRKIQF